MVYVLPTFRGYTVDVRLKEFRTVWKKCRIEVIPFDGPKGDALLAEWLKTLPDVEWNEVVSRIF